MNKHIVTQDQINEYHAVRKQYERFGVRVTEWVRSLADWKYMLPNIADRFDKHHHRQQIADLEQKISDAQAERAQMRDYLDRNKRILW